MKFPGCLITPAFLLLAACEQSGTFAVRVEMLETPAHAESFAPQLFASSGRVSLSWLARDGEAHALRYATWQGDNWGAAREVTRGDDWFANWADLPGVRPRQNGGWLAWWLQKSGPDTYAYDVQLAISEDGTQWQPAGTPHRDGTRTEHGFVTAFDLPDGRMGMVWLDGRNTAGGHHGHGSHGGMTLRYGELQQDGTPHERELDGLVCDCCQTDSAWADDTLVLAYRNRTEEEIRDIHVQRFVDGSWERPVPVHADNWKIAGCPVNGPAIAADGDLVAVSWFTAPAGAAEVRVAISRDGGRTFETPLRVDDGRPEGRTDVLMHSGQVIVSWLERTASGAEIRLRRVADDGEMSESITLTGSDASRAGGFPRLAGLADGTVLMTWTDTAGGGRQVRAARLYITDR